MIYEVSMVPAPDFCTLPARSSRKYKSLTMFQWFQHLAFVLWQSCQLESTNDLRSFNGSSTWLLYFGNPASSRVQMIYEASRGSGACSLYYGVLCLAAWGEYGANAGVHLCKSAFVEATTATTAETALVQNCVTHCRIGFFF